MSKLIVANGCSFTQEYYLNVADRWTHKCGVTTNLALGGGSNERIFYTTIEYLNNHSPDVLIIGWSGIERYTLPRSNGSMMIITPQGNFDENLGVKQESFSEFYYKNCHNDFINLTRTLNYMIHLQQVCKSKKIKLLYFNALLPDIDDQSITELAKQAFMSREDKDTERMGIQHNIKKIEELIGRVDKDIWINVFWYSMLEHCKEFPLEKEGHPDVEGSNHWSKLVKQYL